MENVDTSSAVKKPRKPAARRIPPANLTVMHWPAARTPATRIGALDDSAPHMLYVHVRTSPGIDPSNARDFSNVALQIALGTARDYSLEFVAYEVPYANAGELTELLKLVNELNQHLPKPMRDGENELHWEPVTLYLPRMFSALGISECWQIEKDREGLAPIFRYLEDLTREITRRLTVIARTAQQFRQK